VVERDGLCGIYLGKRRNCQKHDQTGSYDILGHIYSLA